MNQKTLEAANELSKKIQSMADCLSQVKQKLDWVKGNDKTNNRTRKQGEEIDVRKIGIAFHQSESDTEFYPILSQKAKNEILNTCIACMEQELSELTKQFEAL